MLPILVSLVLTAQQALACMGGRVEYFGGNLVLTSDNVISLQKAYPVEQVLRNKSSYGDHNLVVRVEYVKRDAGGIIYTIYSLNRGNKAEYIKVESNYKGNGVRTRGMSLDPQYKLSKTYGC